MKPTNVHNEKQAHLVGRRAKDPESLRINTQRIWKIRYSNMVLRYSTNWKFNQLQTFFSAYIACPPIRRAVLRVLCLSADRRAVPLFLAGCCKSSFAKNAENAEGIAYKYLKNYEKYAIILYIIRIF